MQNESNNTHIPYANKSQKRGSYKHAMCTVRLTRELVFYILGAGLDYGEEVHQLVKNS